MSSNMLVPHVDHRMAAWVEFQRQQKLEQKNRQETFTITLSRMFGCEAYLLAEALKKRLEASTGATWTIFDKALIDKIDSKHNLSKSLFENLGDKSTFIDEIIAGLSKHWKSERDAYQLMARMIYSIASEGNAIIVGRGAAVIASSISNAYHFRLEASQPFRIKKYARRTQLTLDEAKAVVTQNEMQRDKFFEGFLNVNIHNADNYHAVFNNEKCSIDGIASTILHYVHLQTNQ